MKSPWIFALIKTIIFANLSQYNANTAISAFYIARHQLVKLGIAWEFIDKRNKRVTNLENPLSCTNIRDITELKVGDIKELGKLDTAMDTWLITVKSVAVLKVTPFLSL